MVLSEPSTFFEMDRNEGQLTLGMHRRPWWHHKVWTLSLAQLLNLVDLGQRGSRRTAQHRQVIGIFYFFFGNEKLSERRSRNNEAIRYSEFYSLSTPFSWCSSSNHFTHRVELKEASAPSVLTSSGCCCKLLALPPFDHFCLDGKKAKKKNVNVSSTDVTVENRRKKYISKLRS